MSFLINAANLHSGGGVQVATSVIYEISKLSSSKNLNIIVSTEVNENLMPLEIDVQCFKSYNVANIYGMKDIFSSTAKFISSFDVVFTIFGPSYLIIKPAYEIVGFAQPWIIYPNNEVYKNLNWKNKIFTRAKFFIQKLFFLRADHIIVELEHVKERLLEISFSNSIDISVVHNCVSSLYYESDAWMTFKFPNNLKSDINIGYITRDYPHKNLDLLPVIKDILLKKYSINANIFVTLTEKEWTKKTLGFKNSVINVGSINVNQCPFFYNNIDLVLFPSLLECFSATPLEALIMRKPLFSSDRKYVRDVCYDFAEYFEPTNPESAAEAISKHYPFTHERLNSAMEHAKHFSSAKERAVSYLNIMKVSE